MTSLSTLSYTRVVPKLHIKMDEKCKATILKYCPRCVIRFLNLQWSLIIKSEVEIKKHLEEKYKINLDGWFGTESEEMNIDICTEVCNACLGILQDHFVLKCFNSVESCIKTDCYDFDSYQTYFILPVQLLVTEHIAIENFKQLDLFKHSGIEIKEVLKALVEPKLSQHLQCERSTSGVLEISIHIDHEQTELEILPNLKSKSPDSFKNNLNPRKKRVKLNNEKQYTSSQVRNAVQKVKFTNLSDVCSGIKEASIVKSVKLFRVPVYVGGRYNKYSRDLPQTPWLVGGERKRESSVEDYITGPIIKSFLADSENFSSSGREDVDVRMLGNGRPFLVELVNSRKSCLSEEELKKLEIDINQRTEDVAVSNLKVVSKADCKQLKEGEQEKTKSYLAVCYFVKPPSQDQLEKLDDLSNISELVIKQRTPVRVLHRRPLAIRPRSIHSMAVSRGCNAVELWNKGCDSVNNGKVEGSRNGGGDGVVTNHVEDFDFLNDNRLFILELNTQAGTYIKEFVHGDFGRTSPKLGDLLLGEVDIIRLDVKSVDIKWPP